MLIDGDSIFYQNDNLQEKEATSLLGFAKCFRRYLLGKYMDKNIRDLFESLESKRDEFDLQIYASGHYQSDETQQRWEYFQEAYNLGYSHAKGKH